MVCANTLNHLGFTGAHFDVRKGDGRVWEFDESFGIQRVPETDQNYFFRIDREAVAASRERYRRLLDGSVPAISS
jgi:hypothetical protein